jgi:hypothetical protein
MNISQQSRFSLTPLVLMGWVALLFTTLPIFAQPTDTVPSTSVATKDEATSVVQTWIAGVKNNADPENRFEALFPPGAQLVEYSTKGDVHRFVFNSQLTLRGWKPESVSELMIGLATVLGLPTETPEEFIQIFIREQARGGTSNDVPFENYITSPELIKQRGTPDDPSILDSKELLFPVAENASFPAPIPTRSLWKKNVVIGSSHGWTWHKENRWQFQRARLFTIIEDLYPMSYINPFIIPMLENAGATVFSLRERDFQTAEVIVDNDEQTDGSTYFATDGWTTSTKTGWRGGIPASLGPFDEPFTMGTSLVTEFPSVQSGAGGTDVALYTPNIPRAGSYAVYVSWPSYPNSSPGVPVTVKHLGGSADFMLNQMVAGGTWVYLGHFEFDPGINPEKGSVSISAIAARYSLRGLKSGEPTIVGIDAVRFGGGMGNIAPEGLISGHPRYTEGARYAAQYFGMPADSVYHLPMPDGHFGPDYNRDITTRGEWSNYLMGAPSGPNTNRELEGGQVPIDVNIAFHTDAGIDPDGLIGTLGIYRTRGQLGDASFPDGRSRLLNRDLTVMLSDEICRTIRSQYTSTWPRRAVMDRSYGEARRSNTPSMILELLSHQNFNDMKYGLDPNFKKDASRAIYKAIAKFIAAQEGREIDITPLEVRNLAARHVGDGEVVITWSPTPDPLEPSAVPRGYIVYRSADGRAWGNGSYVQEERLVRGHLPPDETEYYKVVAYNNGGISLPSHVVAVRWSEGKEPLLLVDGFSRVSGPAMIDEEFARGFDRATDPGVGYIANYGLVGDQYDFDPSSPWQNDLEAPGWGASKADWQSRLEHGNTFDTVVPYARALGEVGYAFDSCTGDALAVNQQVIDHPMIVWAAGLQKPVDDFGIEGEGSFDGLRRDYPIMDDVTAAIVSGYLSKGGKLILSGAYVLSGQATEKHSGYSKLLAEHFGGISLAQHNRRGVNHVHAAAGHESLGALGSIRFGSDLRPPINMIETVIGVPSADVFTVKSANEPFLPILHYADLPSQNLNDNVAAVAKGNNKLLAGFPLETILPVKKRNDVMKIMVENMLALE